MTDHETFVLLAAKQLSEPLSSAEEDELAAHLAECRRMSIDRCRHATRQRSVAGRAGRRNGLAARSRSRARRGDRPAAHRRAPRARPRGGPVLGVLAIPFFAGGRTEATPPPSARAEVPTSRSDAIAGALAARTFPVAANPSCPRRHRIPGRSSPGRTCTGHDLHAATPSPPSSWPVNRQVSGRESALPTAPGTHMPGRSRAS